MIIAFWILFAVSLMCIVVSFIMAPDSNPNSGALVGSNDLDLFRQSKEKGSKRALKVAMFAIGFVILILSVVIRILM